MPPGPFIGRPDPARAEYAPPLRLKLLTGHHQTLAYLFRDTHNDNPAVHVETLGLCHN